MLVLLVNICLWCERRVAVAGRWWAPTVHAHLNIRWSKFVYQHQHVQTQITTFLSIAASFSYLALFPFSCSFFQWCC
jgi:hypothetical protein